MHHKPMRLQNTLDCCQWLAAELKPSCITRLSYQQQACLMCAGAQAHSRCNCALTGQHHLSANGAAQVGISAPQGCGKSTIVAELQKLYQEYGLRCASVSIDDFYLSHADQQAVCQRYPDNGLLQGRGNAGSHDVKLGAETLGKLCQLGYELFLLLQPSPAATADGRESAVIMENADADGNASCSEAGLFDSKCKVPQCQPDYHRSGAICTARGQHALHLLGVPRESCSAGKARRPRCRGTTRRRSVAKATRRRKMSGLW